MGDPLYPEKKIHLRSFPNVETERLQARFQWIQNHWKDITRLDTSRNTFAQHVQELINIERELSFRKVDFTPFTDGKHLRVPVEQVRRMLPAEGGKSREQNSQVS